MLPFLALAAFVLSGILLADLVRGARESVSTEREQWQRAMSALSSGPRLPSQALRDSSAVAGDRYDLAA